MGAGLGGSLGTLGANGAASSQGSRRIERIGLEVYTVRNELKKDFEGTLAKVREIGYDEIEFGPFPTPDVSIERMQAAVSKTGLRAVSGHVSPQHLEDGLERLIEQARTVGLTDLVCSSLSPEDSHRLEDYRMFAHRLSKGGALAKAGGLRFGFHNHEKEFRRIDGTVIYDLILAETDPESVFMQMDLFWITLGGGDPLAYFSRYPGRFRSVHVKDMDARRGMVDVGSGTIDFARIFAHREQAGIEHYFVEHDEPASPFESIRRSHDYLRQLEF